MKYFVLSCLVIVTYLLCHSCAKQSTPNGGPKDSIPPTLLSSTPSKKQLNYKGKKVDMYFSEEVALANAKEQVIITPSVNKDFTVIAKKKTVTIEFEKDLQDSTTYTINMRESVQDITEKNAAKNLQLAFSTGPYIDSLNIDGKIFDILKGTPMKDVTVALYRYSDSINIYKHKPVYITKTNDKGIYRIENLRADKYFIYAYDDKNKNLIVDSKNESYGFKSEPIQLKESISNLDIPIQKLDARTLKLTSARPYSNYFNIKTTKSLTTFELQSDSFKLISCYGEDKANVRVYNTFPNLDSVKTTFKGLDSIGNSIDTTLFIKFNKKKTEPEKLSMQLNELKIYAKTGLLKATIVFNKPIATMDFDSLLYQPDSTNTFNITEADTQWDFLTNILTIKKKTNPKLFNMEQPQNRGNDLTKTPTDPKQPPKKIISNQFTIGMATFISIDSDSSKKTTQSPTILREEETGILLASVITNHKNFIVQLLTKDFKLLESVGNSKSISFNSLPPSSYLIRVIIDTNGNGKWDPGNFFKREEPEEIIFYRNDKDDPVLTLKANWELGPLLITF